MDTFEIGKNKVGKGCKPFVIAEIAQSHDGSLGIAHSYIDAVAEAGADAIKFQTHIAEAESSKSDKFRVPFSYEDKTRYDYWKRMEFTKEQWLGLYNHSIEKELFFLSSPFSMEAAKLLDQIGCAAWKVGSGEITNDFLLDFMGKTQKPILLSSGMSSYSEIDRAVKKLSKIGNPYALFQSTSKYPTSLEEVGLNVLEYFSRKYNVPVGLSDHSGMIFPSLFAMARGASFIEVHVTFHKSMFGPDVKSSLTIDELKILVQGADSIYLLDRNPVNKDRMAKELNEMKRLFEKSLATSKNLKKGTILKRNMLKGLKPGTGIPICDIEKIIGHKLSRDLEKNTILNWDDIYYE